MNRLRVILSAMGFIACLAPVAPAAAEGLDDIYALADRKEFDTALKKLNTYLAEHPQDAQGRFLKGLIFTETKQYDQAIGVFTQLNKDYPELPEPYNNLAVLYAERGQFEKAQEALAQAVKAHPNYATAHENLGDIHAKMASQAYARAMKLNPNNATLTSKFNRVKTLFTDSTAGQEPAKSAAITPPPVPRKEAEKETPAAAASTPKPTAVAPPPPPPPPPAVKESAAEPKPAAPKESAEAKPAVETGKPGQPGVTSDQAKSQHEVQQAIRAWAAAWSAKNIDQYLAAYSPRFQPFAKSLKSRADWEKNRREVIGRAGSIQIQVADLQVNLLNDHRAQVSFTQNYTSKNFRDVVKKSLSMEREENGWKIVREYADE
ncbi:MAG: tetratricopeptide repeat protein [Magnetococcales bacterium]|nr:tetratricopeptide repeat protein [Magnetococcales bacterium]